MDTFVTFNPTRTGTCFVAAPSQEAADHLASLSCIGETRVWISKNAQLNASIGTVILPHHVATGDRELKDYPEDIKYILEATGITYLQIDTFTRPSRSYRRQPLRIVKTTFDSRSLPSSIILAGAKCSVQECIPSPTGAEDLGMVPSGTQVRSLYVPCVWRFRSF